MIRQGSGDGKELSKQSLEDELVLYEYEWNGEPE